MRRATNLSTLYRAASALSAFGAASSQRRMQSTLYSTTTSSTINSLKSTLLTKFAAHSVAGSLLFSTATAEAFAKEPISIDLVPKEVVLYQYEACPFCNKVKAFLDYYDIPYNVVEVNPMSKKEIKWSDYKKVPILMVDGKQMVDSSAIIDELSEKIHPGVSAGSLKEDDEEKKWRGWVDNHLVHILSPNIYRNPTEALESFEYITKHGNFSFTERLTAKYAGAVAMYFVSKNLKKKYNITDERASLYEAAETWVDALDGRDFLGGATPNLADLAVFGVLRPIRYLRSGKDMVEHTRIGDWYTRMEDAVGVPSRIQV
ncbi:reductase [Lithospermum erythrorhizon]|uniref:Prostaglandin E synthase 2 n=1 Tax=Lithospermum erythrorhizon TaxID=34254 RepID=A0AAV3R6D4_LITER